MDLKPISKSRQTAFGGRILMFRQSDNEFLDGNEAYPYLPEGFLLSEEEIPELADWYDRWDRASAETFAPPEIPFGPFASRRKRKPDLRAMA